MLSKIRSEIKSKENPKKASTLQKFFKTGKGEYGEGDIFLGIIVPELRKIAIKYENLPLNYIQNLLKSRIHEERLLALLILVHNYQKYSEKRKEIYDFYIKSLKYINNWDLVDLSCYKIVGHYLLDKEDRFVLYQLAKSDNLWERRIAIVSTFYFIKNNQFNDTLTISKLLLRDKHDIIHKAVGWMLRETGKRDINALLQFLNKYHKIMPRIMLRYSIEKLSEKQKKLYLM